jgi:hypothetical protein
MAVQKQSVVRTYPRWSDVRESHLEKYLKMGYRVIGCNQFAYSYDDSTGTVVYGNEYILEKECDE